MVNGQSIIDAIGYTRVSTNHEEQQLSLVNQRESILRYCEDNSIYLHNIFQEKEISAKSDVGRDAYKELQEALFAIKPYYLIVKDNDRLNRNLEGNSTLMKILRKTDTKIFNLLNNTIIDPKKPGDVMINTVNALLGEQYTLQQHYKGVNAHEKKCADKRLSAQNNCFGYRYNKETQQMEIVEEEAAIIRDIVFHQYVFEGKGSREISYELGRKGIKGFGSNKLVTPPCVLNWLGNPAYKGKMPFNKVGSEFGYGNGEKTRRFKRPKSDWVYVDVPPIVDEEIFDLAQEIREGRNRKAAQKMDYKTRFGGTHLYSSLLYCDCGSSMRFRYANRAETIGVYKCNHTRKKDLITCSNPYSKIYEQSLNEIVKEAINSYRVYEEQISGLLLSALEQAIENENSNNTEIHRIEQHIKNIEKKLKKIERTIINVSSDSLQRNLNKQYEELEKEKFEFERKLTTLSTYTNKRDEIINRVEQIRKEVKILQNIETIDRSVIERYINKIIIHSDGTIEIRLNYGKTYFSSYPCPPDRDNLFCLDVDTRKTRGTMVLCLQAMPTRLAI